MTPTPTMLLRFVLRDEIIHNDGATVTAKTTRVLQQFWAHPDGEEILRNKSDLFRSVNGTWRDVPLETT